MTDTTPTINPATDQEPTGRNRSRPARRRLLIMALASTLTVGAAAGFTASRNAAHQPDQQVHHALAASAADPAAKAVSAAARTVARATANPPVVDEVTLPVEPEAPAPTAVIPAQEPGTAAEAPAEAATPGPTGEDGPAADEAEAADPGDEAAGAAAEDLSPAEAAAAQEPARPAAPATTVPATEGPAPAPATPAAATEWLAPSGASPFANDLEARLVDLVNAERAAAGVAALVPNWSIGQVSAGWTARMVGSGGLSHNPAYAGQILAALPCRTLAENVGYAASLEQVHAALMQSPGHRANILNPAFTLIGVGVSWDGGGRLWVTQNFCG